VNLVEKKEVNEVTYKVISNGNPFSIHKMRGYQEYVSCPNDGTVEGNKEKIERIG